MPLTGMTLIEPWRVVQCAMDGLCFLGVVGAGGSLGGEVDAVHWSWVGLESMVMVGRGTPSTGFHVEF